MYLVDVNILVYAYVTETPDNYRYAEWLENLLGANNEFGMSELVLSSFLRIVTKRLFQNRRRWNASSAANPGFQPPGRQYNYRPNRY